MTLPRNHGSGVPGSTAAPGTPAPREQGDPALLDEHGEEAVQEALEHAARKEETGNVPEVRVARPKLWLVVYVGVFTILALGYPLIGSGISGISPEWEEVVRNVAHVALLALLVRAAVTGLDVLLARLDDPAARFTLGKVANLIGWLVIAFIGVTQLFTEWYTAAASLGLASLILGFALQQPITSFFAWVYILIRRPYRVGDRIKIGEATGDVINVGYLDTTLWEFGGPYLSTDYPSGRLIKFPNSKVLTETVFNYSWPLFPYIWNEVKFHVAYDSDLEFIARTMREVVEAELGEAMMRRVGRYRELLAQTPVDELQVQERPTVVFRVSDNTWVEAIVRYVVTPRQAGTVKTRLIKQLLARLNAEPDRVLFPKSNLR